MIKSVFCRKPVADTVSTDCHIEFAVLAQYGSQDPGVPTTTGDQFQHAHIVAHLEKRQRFDGLAIEDGFKCVKDSGIDVRSTRGCVVVHISEGQNEIKPCNPETEFGDIARPEFTIANGFDIGVDDVYMIKSVFCREPVADTVSTDCHIEFARYAGSQFTN